MSSKNNRRNNMGNKNQSIQSREGQSQGLQNQGKTPRSGMRGGSQTNLQGQGPVAGSTGTDNQGRVGNTMNGK